MTDPRHPTPAAGRARRLGLVALAALAGAVLAWGAFTGFGAWKGMALAVLGALLALTAWDRELRWAPGVMVFLLASYAGLLLTDLALALIVPLDAKKDYLISTRGMLIPDDEIGYRLNPGWTGSNDDGVVTGTVITINADGHRDAPPAGDGARRTLILGDSFAFGTLLDDAETIDRQIERVSGGEIDAYNLGVPGYGASAVEAMFARTQLPAASAVYVFYRNDLRNDNLATDRMTVRHGFMVPRFHSDGRALTEEEIDARVRELLSDSSFPRDVLRLDHIVRVVDRLRRGMSAPEGLPRGDAPFEYREGNVATVARHTLNMRDLARERGMLFAVLVVPSIGEARRGAYHDLVQEYVEALRDSDVTVLESLDGVSDDDFHLHDGHFNASGSEKAARLVADWLAARS